MPTLSGLILVGGQSSRFGRDKASAMLAGRPLLQWTIDALLPACDEIVVVSAPGQPVAIAVDSAVVRLVQDEQPGLGPVSGLAAGFEAVASELVFATSCDAPLLCPGLVKLLVASLGDHDAVCAEVEERVQPLAALYRAESARTAFRKALAEGQLRLSAVVAALDVQIVPESEIRAIDPSLESFININRAEDLRRVEAIVGARSSTLRPLP